MLPSLKNLPINAPKRPVKPDPEQFDIEGWIEEFNNLQFVENYEETEKIRQEARATGKYYYDLLTERGVEDFHWLNYDRSTAEDLDNEKARVLKLFQKLVANPTQDVLTEIIDIHTAMTEDMEMLKKDPFSRLWRLMKYAIKEALESYPTIGDDWEWEEGDADAAMSGVASAQHGYYARKMRKQKKSGKRR